MKKREEVRTLPEDGLERLIGLVRSRGYCLVGPTLRDGAIVYDEISAVSDLPAGWTDEQEAGRYRVKAREDAAAFGYNLGPHSWKRFLYPPRTQLWQTTPTGEATLQPVGAAARAVQELDFIGGSTTPDRPFAFLGVRACELSAVAIQDRVLMGGAFPDPHYQSRRESALFIAVNCSQAAATCFCVSMGTGPEVTGGFDIVLTELLEDGSPAYLARAGSAAGESLLAQLEHGPASPAELDRSRVQLDQTAGSMRRELAADEVRGLLAANLEHPRWDDVASRCLACTNCTMVCPTCFCSTVEDHTSLDGTATRTRSWDSCFSLDFSYVHGGSVRASTRARYRQWLTHKLSTWHDQFDSSGCVGCGRCIAWCPVGIDLTEEVRAIASEPGDRQETTS
ncbi:MAG: 4Fe-4S dicluster domain-containing protein [Chromatiales bacterium]|nr:4Fe-4S dicluster domain-containing protein [Chromatiales bacterium]